MHMFARIPTRLLCSFLCRGTVSVADVAGGPPVAGVADVAGGHAVVGVPAIAGFTAVAVSLFILWFRSFFPKLPVGILGQHLSLTGPLTNSFKRLDLLSAFSKGV
jgi:hypothetical protein